ncbi:MAG: deoxyribonuclease IV [Planctomycetes bacterium]|nr:deoxyribonuclease IV [Planctomycetota bacterium]
MPLLGAHMSIAGGYYRAVDAAGEHTMDVVQLFTKNNNQWRAKPISEEDAARFRAALKERKIRHPLSHSSYLINLAAADAALWKKSVESFIEELRRADRLGIPYVVLHPGAFTCTDEETGLKAVIRALDEVHRQTPELKSQCLLETTAGQGTCLGCRFQQLATILDGVQDPARLGVCVDTCHIFAAGYPLGTPKEYKATFRDFDAAIGLTKIKAFHLNDSKRELGSRVDRHEHIGRGKLGLEPFRLLLNDRRFRKVPMYLETPKGEHNGRTWDAVNLEMLRSLVA